MAKVTHLVSSFTGGELSPRLDGRPDLKKYSQGCRVLENFLVMPHGGAKKRSGSQFVVQQNGTGDVALVPFQYSTEQAYILMFGANYVWFFKDRGLITQTAQNITNITRANPGVVTYSGSDTYSNGDKVLIQSVSGMTEVNNRWFTVANVNTGANTFELSGVDTSAYTAYTSGGTVAEIVELTTTYTADQVLELQFAQSADTLFIVHKSHPLRKIQRSSHTSWTLSTPDITTGPFRPLNGDRNYKITPSEFNKATVTGATQANPCVITCSGGHNFSNGVTVAFTGVGGMTNLNTGTYVVANATATTFQLQGTDSTGWPAYTSGGTVTQNRAATQTYPTNVYCKLTATGGSPFAAGQVGALFRLSADGNVTGIQSPPLGDVTGGALSVGKVYTTDGKIYGFTAVTTGSAWNWGHVNRVPNHDSGVARIYFVNQPTTEYADVAFLHPNSCNVRITEYISPTEVRAQIIRYHMPQEIIESGTSFWEEGAWSDYRGYPRAITFYEQRLFFAGVEGDPSVVWSSKTGAYENFTDGTEDNDALVYRVPARSADVIRWLCSSRALMAGSSFGEFAFASSSQNQALTPSNVKATVQTSYGSSNCVPIQINQAVLYPQRNGSAANAARKIREFQYRYDQDAFGSTDMTVFSEHITGQGIVRLAYQTEPDSIIWALRTDGTLAACTYERLQEVVAWHRHELGGTGAAVKTIAAIPGAAGDELWLSVERTIAGGTVRYIEVFAPTFKDNDAKEDAKILDAYATYEGSSTTSISGLWHLRGETVKVLSNGAVYTGTVSSTGRLTLTRATTKAHIGYGYTGIIETEDIEAGAQAGTAQSRAKRISQIYVNMLNSLGGQAGPDSDSLKRLLYRTPADPMGSSPPLFSGHVELDFDGGWERFARVRIEHEDPLPCHITSMVVELSVTG